MHPAAAIILLITNFFLPGIGTMIAGFLALCGLANPGSKASSVLGTFCINFFIGIAQLVTVVFFLIGWLWAIFWGVLFIGESSKWNNPTSTVTTVTTTNVSESGVNYNPTTQPATTITTVYTRH